MPDKKKEHPYLETLFKHVEATDTGAFLLGFILAVLLAVSNVLESKGFFGVYAASLVVVILLLFFLRYYNTNRFDRPRWGVITTLVMGYGTGALVYIYRGWFKWVWQHLLMINTKS